MPRQPDGAPPTQTTPAASAPASSDIVAVPEPTPTALQYHRSGIVLWGVTSCGASRFRRCSCSPGSPRASALGRRRIGRKWFFVVGIYFAIFTIIGFVIDLPLAYYQGFVRQHAYGLSNQTLGKWVGDR